MPHTVEDLLAYARDPLQQFIPDLRMAFHDLVFARVKTTGLVENCKRNTGLPDVVQGCRNSESLHVGTAEPDLQPEAHRHARHQQAMLERSFMIFANVVEPGAKSVLS